MRFTNATARAERALYLAILFALPGCYASTVGHPVFQLRGVYASGPEFKGVFRGALRGDETFSPVRFSRIKYGVRGGQQRLLDWPAVPKFCVQLAPSAPPTRTDSITPEFASRWLERSVPTPAERANEVGPPAGDVFVGTGCNVGFDLGDGKVSWLILESSPTGPKANPSSAPSTTDPSASSQGPRIGPASCESLFALPLNRAQLVETFGEPDWEGWTRGEGNLLILF